MATNPCPWCGYKTVAHCHEDMGVSSDHYFKCLRCLMRGPISIDGMEEAEERWNRLAALREVAGAAVKLLSLWTQDTEQTLRTFLRDAGMEV